jgi:hypothetical protein
MHGFEWRDREAPPSPLGEDAGWCVRNAFCALFGWPEESPDWAAFIPDVTVADVLRLIDHVGVVQFPPGMPPHPGLEDHPGVAIYKLDRFPRYYHCDYQPNVRHLVSPGGVFETLQARRLWVAVDPRQPPHALRKD